MLLEFAGPALRRAAEWVTHAGATLAFTPLQKEIRRNLTKIVEGMNKCGFWTALPTAERTSIQSAHVHGLRVWRGRCASDGAPPSVAFEILSLKEDHYELHCCAEEKGKLASLVLAGLEFDLSEIQ